MTIFFCSDHHFGQKSLLKYFRADGKKLRSFQDINEMNETIIYNHNSVVKKSDTVFFLGDVAEELHGLDSLERMNGNKILIKGNHDILHINHYLKHFDDILAVKVFPKDFICSHIPLNKSSLRENYGFTNVHGHTHSNVLPDKSYINVSMENISFTPISYEEILDKIKEFKD